MFSASRSPSDVNVIKKKKVEEGDVAGRRSGRRPCSGGDLGRDKAL